MLRIETYEKNRLVAVREIVPDGAYVGGALTRVLAPGGELVEERGATPAEAAVLAAQESQEEVEARGERLRRSVVELAELAAKWDSLTVAERMQGVKGLVVAAVDLLSEVGVVSPAGEGEGG